MGKEQEFKVEGIDLGEKLKGGLIEFGKNKTFELIQVGVAVGQMYNDIERARREQRAEVRDISRREQRAEVRDISRLGREERAEMREERAEMREATAEMREMVRFNMEFGEYMRKLAKREREAKRMRMETAALPLPSRVLDPVQMFNATVVLVAYKVTKYLLRKWKGE